jgi:CheY-like chemotaxis protein
MKQKKNDRASGRTTSPPRQPKEHAPLGIEATSGGLQELIRAMPDDTRDGRWYSVHIRPLDGAVLMMPDDLPEERSVAAVHDDLGEESLDDVTERDRLEKELRERTEELNAANRSNAEFIAVLSHELRTPLNAISGWAELLKNPALSEGDRMKGAEVIARNAKVQAQLISDFLDVHKTETEKLNPEATPTPAPVAVTEREAGDAPDSLRGLKVLVVDDDVDAHQPIRWVLEDYGAEVVAVRSVTAALDAIPQHRPDVLVSDINMPGRDGYDLIRAVRALPRHRGGATPAIALTGFGTAEERARALNAGYMNHFAKPIEATVLVAVVAGLGARRLRSAAEDHTGDVVDEG